MSAPRRLRAVAAPPLPPLWTPRPSWAYPDNDAQQSAYLRALEYLRRDQPSRWVMDRNSRAPGWRSTNPTE